MDSYAQIDDEVSGHRTQGIKDRYVSHYWQHFYPSSGPLHFASGNSSAWWEWRTKVATYCWDSATFGDFSNPLSGLPKLTQDDHLGGKFVIPTDNVRDLIERSYKTLLPRIRPKLSLLNDIVELRDFKSLPRSINNTRNLITRLTENLRRWMGRNAPSASLSLLLMPANPKYRAMPLGKLLKLISKVGSDAFLQWNFNIQPLLTDIAASVKACSSVFDEIQKLIDAEGRPQVRHCMIYLDDLHPERDEYAADKVPLNLYGTSRCRRVVKNVGRPVFRALMRYSYRIPTYQRANARVLGFLDSFGAAGFRPSVLWNAIPWSFVVDWTLGISEWLKANVDEGGLCPVTVIHGYVYSFEVNRDIFLYNNVQVDFPVRPGPGRSSGCL